MATTINKRTDELKDYQKVQSHFAMSAFNAIKATDIVYISFPVTSGPRLYDFMDAHGFKTIEEAKTDSKGFLENVLKPNLQDGMRISEEWSKKIAGAVITPAEFEKRLRTKESIDWGQDNYMGMWIPLISEKITHLVMLDGWQYSNGACEEFLQAMLMQMGRDKRSNIKITDVRGETLPLDKALKLVADAYKNMHARGLKPRNMAETLSLLLESEERLTFQQTQGLLPPVDRDPARKNIPALNVPPYDSKKVEAIRQEILPLLVADYPDILAVLKTTSSFHYSPINALFRKKRGKTPEEIKANIYRENETLAEAFGIVAGTRYRDGLFSRHHYRLSNAKLKKLKKLLIASMETEKVKQNSSLKKELWNAIGAIDHSLDLNPERHISSRVRVEITYSRNELIERMQSSLYKNLRKIKL